MAQEPSRAATRVTNGYGRGSGMVVSDPYALMAVAEHLTTDEPVPFNSAIGGSRAHCTITNGEFRVMYDIMISNHRRLGRGPW